MYTNGRNIQHELERVKELVHRFLGVRREAGSQEVERQGVAAPGRDASYEEGPRRFGLVRSIPEDLLGGWEFGGGPRRTRTYHRTGEEMG